MKKLITLLFVLCTIATYAQHYAPSSFTTLDSGTTLGSPDAMWWDAIHKRLIVGGVMDSVGSVGSGGYIPSRGFAYFDSTGWHDQSGTYGNDWTLCVDSIFHGLQSGAIFRGIQTDTSCIVKFDTAVQCLIFYHDTLYALGNFTKTKQSNLPKGTIVNGIAKWDGVNWHTVSTGLHLGTGSGSGYCAVIWKDLLYIGGIFDHAGTVACNDLVAFNGTNFISVSGVYQTTPKKVVHGMTIGQGLDATWDGNSWHIFLPNTPTSVPTGVHALCVFNNQLVVGGDFNTAGTTTCSNLACFDGSNYSNMGISLNGEVDALIVYDTSLWVGGQFSYLNKFNRVATLRNGFWNAPDIQITTGNKISAFAVTDMGLVEAGKFQQVQGVAVGNMIAYTPGSHPSLLNHRKIKITDYRSIDK